MVNVPDSISIKLDNAYSLYTGYNDVNAGKNVWNLLDRKDFCFKNGIYSYKGQGPHFQRLIFIYYNLHIYCFTNRSINKVLEEFIECTELFQIEEVDKIHYLKAISIYMDEEYGETYGAEVK
jgi:hypothetical protein